MSNLTTTNFVANLSGGLPTGDFTSGYIAPIATTDANQTWTLTTNTSEAVTSGYVTISGAQTNTGDVFTFPNSNIWPNTLPNTMPSIGGWTWPPNEFQYPPVVPMPPDLDALEEGVHPIKGGKIIIKKIMVEDSEMDKALREYFTAEEEEAATMYEELEEMAVSEERAV
jgi:hypothetical protein